MQQAADQSREEDTSDALPQALRPRRRRWLSIAGAAIGLGALAWVLTRLDYAALAETLSTADPLYLALVPLAIALEQVVRAWKWRQILRPLRVVGMARLFGAIMAGYLGSLLVPFGLSPLVRSWLVARLEALPMTTVLASVAIDRLIDGLVFAGLVLVVVTFAAFPAPAGDLRLGLVLAAIVSLAALLAALWLLWRYRRSAGHESSWVLRLADRLPRRGAARARALALTFRDGIVWPAEFWRRAGVVAASLVIKLIAATHLLWAGLAFGVVLPPFAYLALLAILGFIVVLAHVARVPGGFVVGAVFALGLFGVAEEQAVAMVGLVVTASLVTIAVVGGVTLWRHGVALDAVRAQDLPSNDSA